MGKSRTRIYRIYRGIINRCYNSKCKEYRLYGARGIKCMWETFEDFYSDMGEEYESHVRQYGEMNTTIDRIDVNGDYCKWNCRWATVKEQSNNTRFNIKIEFNGKKYPSLQYLCDYLGLRYGTLYKKIYIDGKDKDKAILELLSKKQKYKYKGITYKGITDMCKKLGLKRTSISYRLSVGMSIEEAIEKDFRTYKINTNGED